jgi:hypothetical protein
MIRGESTQGAARLYSYEGQGSNSAMIDALGGRRILCQGAAMRVFAERAL